MPNRIDVFYDMIDWTNAELFTFIETAELALVPGAIAGDPEHQAHGFAWRADRPQFKTLIVFGRWHQ
jgi:hypothetical protein